MPFTPPAALRFLLLSEPASWMMLSVHPELAIQVDSWLYFLPVNGESGRVVIVGGGILGTMHAVLARRRGYAVTQLEREPAGRGASVRNFGLVWVSGRRAGAELALALRARALWAEIAEFAPGTGFRPAGSLTIAIGEAELAVMREAAALPDAKQREFELLSADEVRSVNPALRGEFLGGLHCRADAIVEPRVALPALRASLAGPSYEWRAGLEGVEGAAHGGRGSRGDWHRGDLVVLCTGANFTGLAGPHLAASGALAIARDADGQAAAGAEPRGLRRGRVPIPAGPAAVAAGAAVRRPADPPPGRRRLASLLPRLRRAVAGRAAAAAAGRRR